MPVVGSLMLEIKVDTAYIREGLDRAYQQVQSFGQRVNKIFSSFSTLALGYGLYSGLHKVIELTDTQQKAYEQLRTALRSTQNAAGLTFQELKKISEEMQRTTTLGDEAVQKAQVILLTFPKVTKETFSEALRLSADMAERLGGSLESTVLKVGRALQDPIKGLVALRRSGVIFSEEQTKMIKQFVESNNLLKAQEIILKALAERFEGTAQAMRHTLGGAIKSFMNLLGDTFELSSDATKSLVNAIEYLNEHFNYLRTGIKALVGLIQLSLIPLFSKFVQQIYSVVLAIGKLVIKNPFLALITGLAMAVSELIMFRDSLVSIGGTTAKVKDWIISAFGIVKPILSEIIESTKHFVSAWFALFKTIGEKILSVFSTIGSAFKSIFDGLVKLFSPIFNSIFKPIFQSILKIVISVLESIFGKFEDTFSAIVTISKWGINTIIGLFVVLPKTVSVILGSVYEHFKDLFSKLADLGSSFWLGLKNLFTAGDFSFSALTESLKRDFLNPSKNIISQIGESVKESFTYDYLGKLGEEFEPALKEFKAGFFDLGDAFGEVMNLMGEDWTAVWDRIKKEASERTIFEKIKKQALSIEDMIRGKGGIGIGIELEEDLESVENWVDKYNDLVESTRRQIDSQKELNKVFGQLPEIINEVQAHLKAKEEVIKLGITNTEVQSEKIKELTELYKELYAVEQRGKDLAAARDLIYKYDPIKKYNDSMRELIRLNEQGLISMELLNKEQIELREEMIQTYTDLLMKTREWKAGAIVALHNYVKEASNAANNFYSVFSNAFRKLEDEFVSLFTQLKFDFKSLMQSIQADITRAFVRQEITAPLATALGIGGLGGQSMLFSNPAMNMIGYSAGGGLGGFLSGIGNFLVGNFLGGLFGGFFAEGGEVVPGKAYIVGEKGPEIFKPKQSGTIIPNNQITEFKSIVSNVSNINNLNNHNQISKFIKSVFSSNVSNINNLNNHNQISKFVNQISKFVKSIFSNISNINTQENKIQKNENIFHNSFFNNQFVSRIIEQIQNSFGLREIDGLRANGGFVSSGLNYLVGEKGPEIYIPSITGFTREQKETNKDRPFSMFGRVEININVPMSQEQARYSASQIAHELLILSLEGKRNQ